MADINARPPDEREPGNFRDRIAIHNGRDGAGQEKKEKAPQEKSPQQKRETAACGSACLRAATPPSSLASFLSSFGGCAASFSCPLRASLSSCGRLRRPSSLLLLSRFFRAAAPPDPFRFSSASLPLLRRLRRLSLHRAHVGGWRRSLSLYTMKSRLSETHMGIGIPLSPDCENQRFSCQGLLRLSLSEACFVTVTCHELICSPLDFASARHPKGPLSKATGFLHILL